MNIYNCIIIGGGASGLMAAIVAARRGRRVLVLEKNSAVGQKLAITGGGRCNITNVQSDRHVLLANYGAASKFLFSPFAQFSNEDAVAFFEELGLSIKVEANNRAFPVSESAPDVVRVLREECVRLGVEIRTHAIVKQIESADGMITGVVCGGEVLTAESYVLATGGNSHPETGSTGDGFVWLRQLGHTVVAPTPTIVPLGVKEDWVKKLSGTTLENAKVTFFTDTKKAFSVTGNILCTHFGISGPTILNSAVKIAGLLKSGVVTAQFDLFPQLDEGALNQHLIAVFEEHKNKDFKNVLKFLVPGGTAATFLELIETAAGAPLADTPIHSITKEQRKQIVRAVKNQTITITQLMGLDRAVVVDGGIALDEIDMKTMRSKKISNVFVTGDLLHINRPSGGFSLQLCWTTGFVAGTHC